MYYPYSIKIIREKISNLEQKNLKPENQTNIKHVQWMLEQIERMLDNQHAKAGRWIGWILRDLEILGIITNNESRDMIRIDVANHND